MHSSLALMEAPKHTSPTQEALKKCNSPRIGSGRGTQLDVHAERNQCKDAGARALCQMLVHIRQRCSHAWNPIERTMVSLSLLLVCRDLAAVRALFLYQNEIGDEGARAVAELLQASVVIGSERLWVAEIHLSHNNVPLYLYGMVMYV